MPVREHTIRAPSDHTSESPSLGHSTFFTVARGAVPQVTYLWGRRRLIVTSLPLPSRLPSPPFDNGDKWRSRPHAMAMPCYQHVTNKGIPAEGCAHCQQKKLEYIVDSREGAWTTHDDPDLPSDLFFLATWIPIVDCFLPESGFAFKLVTNAFGCWIDCMLWQSLPTCFW